MRIILIIVLLFTMLSTGHGDKTNTNGNTALQSPLISLNNDIPGVAGAIKNVFGPALEGVHGNVLGTESSTDTSTGTSTETSTGSGHHNHRTTTPLPITANHPDIISVLQAVPIAEAQPTRLPISESDKVSVTQPDSFSVSRPAHVGNGNAAVGAGFAGGFGAGGVGTGAFGAGGLGVGGFGAIGY